LGGVVLATPPTTEDVTGEARLSREIQRRMGGAARPLQGAAAAVVHAYRRSERPLPGRLMPLLLVAQGVYNGFEHVEVEVEEHSAGKRSRSGSCSSGGDICGGDVCVGCGSPTTVIEMDHGLVAPPGLAQDCEPETCQPHVVCRRSGRECFTELDQACTGHGHDHAQCGSLHDAHEPACCAHHGDDGHGHGHGHGHTHSFGHGHGGSMHGFLRRASFSSAESAGCAASSTAAVEEGCADASSVQGMGCSSDTYCCEQGGTQPRLNMHCDFRGHCVQMKNTFLHIPCNVSDSESDGECIVCRLTRSRSCDDSALMGLRNETPPRRPRS